MRFRPRAFEEVFGADHPRSFAEDEQGSGGICEKKANSTKSELRSRFVLHPSSIFFSVGRVFQATLGGEALLRDPLKQAAGSDSVGAVEPI